MKTNLAVANPAVSAFAAIHASVTDAVDREYTEPRIAEATRASITQVSNLAVGGFAVYDQEAEQVKLEQARTDRRKEVNTFRDDRDAVTAKLVKLGVPPFAVVPAKAWARICTRSGLICLTPDREGKVRISRNTVKQINSTAESTIAAILLSMVVLSAAVGAAFAAVYQVGWGLGVACAMLCGMGSFIAAGAMEKMAGEKMARAIARRKIKRFAAKPWKEVLDVLLAQDEGASGLAKIVLPTPPTDVAAVLLKAKGLELSVAVVPEAFSFDRPVDKLLLGEHDRIIQERKQQLEQDPIVYYTHGSAVAVIAQFGNFPIEQEVVNEVINSEHLV